MAIEPVELTVLHRRNGCEHGSLQPTPAPAVLSPPSGRGSFLNVLVSTIATLAENDYSGIDAVMKQSNGTDSQTRSRRPEDHGGDGQAEGFSLLQSGV